MTRDTQVASGVMKLPAGSTTLTTSKELRTKMDRRREILDAAYDTFAETGFAGANLDLIARRARLTKPTIYNHFADKGELFVEAVRTQAGRLHLTMHLAIREVFDETRSKWEPNRHAYARSPKHVLLRAGWTIMRFCRDHEAAAFRRLVIAEADHLAEAIDTSAPIVGHSCVQELARAFRAFNTVRTLSIPDEEQAARHFVSLVSGDTVPRLMLGLACSDEEARKTVESGVEVFLDAYRPRGIFATE